MTKDEKIANLREIIEMATSCLGHCKGFIETLDEATPGRRDILRSIKGVDCFMNENFKSEVIQ